MRACFYVLATYWCDEGVALAQFGPFASEDQASAAGQRWLDMAGRRCDYIVVEGVV